MATDIIEKNRYFGQKRNHLRNGYGVYVYENTFFRYEGEWKNGKKHGHGKLLMKDGTYYEGQFLEGEITGHGFKHWASSLNEYTGQFLNGEMDGHGIMRYKDGSIYEGQWCRNQKQGFGMIRSPVGVYNGSFYSHYRHGEGTQTYENGDKYTGNWVIDKRQGQGELQCADGTNYTGQFFCDDFHGEGRMNHASGMCYVGEWHHNLPMKMATKVVILADDEMVVVKRGKPFSLRVCCQNDSGTLVEDDGRELQVSLWFRHYPTKKGSVLFEMIEDVEETPIPTPFGYDVVPYPLTDQPLDSGTDEDNLSKLNLEDTDCVEGQESLEEDGDQDSAFASNEVSRMVTRVNTETNLPVRLSLEEVSLGVEERPSHVAVAVADASSLWPLPVATQRCLGGYAQWDKLWLAPPPPLYRPFVALQEEKYKKAVRAERTDGSRTDMVRQDVGLAPPHVVEPKQAESKMKKSKRAITVSHGNEVVSRVKKRKKKDIIETHSDIKEPEMFTPKKYKAPISGEYVIMVKDVTNPPFVGKTLEPAFYRLKLLRSKKKKPKQDPGSSTTDEELRERYSANIVRNRKSGRSSSSIRRLSPKKLMDLEGKL